MSVKIIFHAPYRLGRLDSGSGVRPWKLYNAFVEEGYDVFLLSGDVPERKERFRELLRRGLDGVRFCYSEPSTYPVHPAVDYRIYYHLRKNKIPTGIYYRDAYWMFDGYFKWNGAKRLLLQARYRADLLVFNRTAKTLFFPTKSFSELFGAATSKVILPPAGELKKDGFYRRKPGNPPAGVYVGGIKGGYGLEMLLESFRLANEKTRIMLNLVCRKEEFDELYGSIKPYIAAGWLRVHHASGEELEKIYAASDFGCNLKKIESYNPLSLSVKLFEYLSYGLPIVATECFEMAKFLKENNTGLAVPYEPEAASREILRLVSDETLYEKISRGVYRTLTGGHLWKDRVKTIAESLGA